MKREDYKRRWSKVKNKWWTGRFYQVRDRKDYRWAQAFRTRRMFEGLSDCLFPKNSFMEAIMASAKDSHDAAHDGESK